MNSNFALHIKINSMNRRIILGIVTLLTIFSSLQAQDIRGIVIDSDGNGMPAIEVGIEGTDVITYTNALGKFVFEDLSTSANMLVIKDNDGHSMKYSVREHSGDIDLGEISFVSRSTTIDASEVAIVSIDIDEESTSESSNISSILTANRDPFVNVAAFNWFAGRFNIRGYRNEDKEIYLNGFPVNDLDDGRVYWGLWGGLNDVFRSQEIHTQMDASTYGIGSIGGSVNVDLRASSQRPQTKVVYNFSNRSYQHRTMITHSSGMQQNGWAYTLSASRRWGNRGYVQGTYSDMYSYFAGVEKKLGNNHTLGLTILGAPTNKGRSSGSTQEMYDLVGDNYYNPNWGYQNGKVRNSRAYKFHQPIGILRHDWKVNKNIDITSSISYMTGYNGATRLDWFNAPDPRPDYYRKLPSYQLNDEGRQVVADYIKDNVDAQQINWHRLYAINRGRNVTIENANGSGEAKTGKLAAYVVQNQRTDNDKIAFNSNVSAFVNDNTSVYGGLRYQMDKVHNYILVDDLLGADYYVDLDKFAERDFPNNNDALQSDLRRPNRILGEGDRYGYDYDIVNNKATAWGMWEQKFDRIDYFVVGDVSYNSFYREGFMQNGKFPDASLGKSETQNFLNYTAKAGATFKLDGRNYFSANGMLKTRAPYARYAYVSPRTRDELLPDLSNETVMAGELSYVFKYPRISGRLTGYYTEFKNKIESFNMYFDVERSFGNYTLRDVNTKHQGLEFGVDFKATQTLSVRGAAALGARQYTNRPTRKFYIDNQPDKTVDDAKVFIKNYFLEGPQSAFSLGLNYNSPKYWFANISVNHFRGIYLDIFPERRTNAAVEGILRPANDKLFYDIIGQRKFNNQTTVDLFAGKSWKFGDYYVLLYASVGNLLDNRDFITGGFEQSRFDFDNFNVDKFQPRVFYSYGTNYMMGLSVSF